MPTVRAEPPLAAQTVTFSPRGAWDYLKQQFSVFTFFATGLLVSPPCFLLSVFFGRKIPAERGQALIRWLFSTWLKMSVRIGVFDIQFPEMDKLRDQRGVIIAPNHPTMLDAVILLSIVPRTVCIMRASLNNSPFLGGAARLARFVTNDSGPALIRQGVEKLHQRENLLIFPEGTRTVSGAVNPFKNGFALIAVKADAPIQTVFIEREASYLGKGVSLFAPTPLPIRYRIHLGEVVRAREGEHAQELAARMEEYFRAHLTNTGEAIRLTSPFA